MVGVVAVAAGGHRRAGSADAVVDHVRGELTELLGLGGCRFAYGSLLGHPPRLGHDGEVTLARGGWSLERRGRPQGETEPRVFGNGHYYGRFMLRPVPTAVVPLQASPVAVTLADQVGAAPGGRGNGRGQGELSPSRRGWKSPPSRVRQ
ncbi:hypothetical protein GCM10010388_76330 [Streptomyces mauvecolor]